MDLDLSLVFSIVAIFVSTVVSAITLWLSEFRGPKIVLLNIPQFKIGEEHACQVFEQWMQSGFVLKILELEPISFVFANHGGRSGTILHLSLDFSPNNSLESYIENWYFDFDPLQTDRPAMPITIKEGDNKCLTASMRINMVDWKRIALASVLESSLTVDQIVEKAWQQSKERFREFAEMLSKSQELGKVSCSLALTSGRFKTKIAEKVMLRDARLEINCDKACAVLMEFLERWDTLNPSKAELLNDISRDIVAIVQELKEAELFLFDRLDGGNISGKRIKVDAWNVLQKPFSSEDRKIRWFLIEKEKGLKEELIAFYGKIAEYNDRIDRALRLGEFRTEKHYKELNIKREKLHLAASKMSRKLHQTLQRTN
jgi:hypothetical protein